MFHEQVGIKVQPFILGFICHNLHTLKPSFVNNIHTGIHSFMNMYKVFTIT